MSELIMDYILMPLLVICLLTVSAVAICFLIAMPSITKCSNDQKSTYMKECLADGKKEYECYALLNWASRK